MKRNESRKLCTSSKQSDPPLKLQNSYKFKIEGRAGCQDWSGDAAEGP